MQQNDPIRFDLLSISEAICVYFYVFDKCILRGGRSRYPKFRVPPQKINEKEMQTIWN